VLLNDTTELQTQAEMGIMNELRLENAVGGNWLDKRGTTVNRAYASNPFAYQIEEMIGMDWR